MDDDKLAELADSIKRHGVLLPLVVIPKENGYEIVDGHRRYLACKLIGLEMIPVRVFRDAAAAKWGMMLDANMMREEVTAAEEGVQFLDLAEKENWTMPQLCHFFGRSEAYINDRVQLVRDFPDVMPHVAGRDMNFSQAKAVMRCPNTMWRAYLCEQATKHGASARTLSEMVEQWKLAQVQQAVQQPAGDGGGPVLVQEPPRQQCVWCQREDDQANIVHMDVHSYHVRDLVEFLRRTGAGGFTRTE
jgi:ParB family chromosome partitioning protein